MDGCNFDGAPLQIQSLQLANRKQLRGDWRGKIGIGASLQLYRGVNKGLYVVARNFFLLLLNCSAWPCLGPA